MKAEINKIINKINLEIYSNSEGFLGYCESKKGLNDNVCWHAINLLFRTFPMLLKNNSLISSLHFDRSILKDSYQTSDANFNRYFVPLKENKIAYEVDFKSISDDINSSYYEEKITELMEFFVYVENIEFEVLKKTIFSVMSVDGLIGHLFLILKKEKLIIYPHDDVGFGFIFFGENRLEISEFLLKSFSDDYLVIHLRKK